MNSSRHLLSFVLAFFCVSVAAALVLHFTETSNPFPPDALIVQTYGHNAEITAALNAAGIPKLEIIDTNSVRKASFATTLLHTIFQLAFACALFLGVFTLLKRLFANDRNG